MRTTKELLEEIEQLRHTIVSARTDVNYAAVQLTLAKSHPHVIHDCAQRALDGIERAQFALAETPEVVAPLTHDEIVQETLDRR